MYSKLTKRFFSLNEIPKKIKGFDQATIWYKFSRLAAMTNSVNLGQGFPDWEPADFVLENIKNSINLSNANHQYTRSYGNMKLAEAIGKKYSVIFKRKIDPANEVLIANGAVSALYSAITGLVGEGDEVVAFEPFYDCYYPQTIFSYGKFIGVPMIPPSKFREKIEFNNLENKILKDEWKIDFSRVPDL